MPVYTVGIQDETRAIPLSFDTLKAISRETGGAFLSAGGNINDLSATVAEITSQAVEASPTATPTPIPLPTPTPLIPDTLLTSQWDGREGVISLSAMRIILLSLVGFVFKLIVNVCIGNNRRSLLAHILLSLLTSIVCAAVVEAGHMMGLPLIAVLGVFWLLMMSQIVIKD